MRSLESLKDFLEVSFENDTNDIVPKKWVVSVSETHCTLLVAYPKIKRRARSKADAARKEDWPKFTARLLTDARK